MMNNRPEVEIGNWELQNEDDYIIKVSLSEGEGFEPSYEEVMKHFGSVVKATMTFSSTDYKPNS